MKTVTQIADEQNVSRQLVLNIIHKSGFTPIKKGVAFLIDKKQEQIIIDELANRFVNKTLRGLGSHKSQLIDVLLKINKQLGELTTAVKELKKK
jgi:predicted DNA-binding protein YlxM (UPF0122 family)